MKSIIAVAGLVVILTGCAGGGGSIPTVVHASGPPAFSGTYSAEITGASVLNGSVATSGGFILIFTATPAPPTGGANTISGEISFFMTDGQPCTLPFGGAWNQDSEGMVTGQMQVPGSNSSCIGGATINIPFTAAPAQAGTVFISTTGAFIGGGLGTVQ
jgi:hypothetical protein